MSHQIVKRVRVGDLTAQEREKYGLVNASENEVVNIAVGNVVKDPPPAEAVPIKLNPGERVEEIK